MNPLIISYPLFFVSVLLICAAIYGFFDAQAERRSWLPFGVLLFQAALIGLALSQLLVARGCWV